MPFNVGENEIVFQMRPIEVVDLPIDDHIEIEQPERVVIKIGKSSVDIGSLCYIRRSKTPRKRSCKNHTYSSEVELSSLSKERCRHVVRLIQFLSGRLSSGGYRSNTVIGNYAVLKAFIDWCDDRQFHDALSGESGTYTAFKAYIDYLREQVNCHMMRPAYATGMQHKISKLLESIFDLHDLDRNVELMPHSRADIVHVEPPSESDLAKLCGLSHAVFEGVANFVLNVSPYPYRLELPHYLNWAPQGLWIFPEQQWCMPPHLLLHRATRARKNPNYDYLHGRVLTFEEAIEMPTGKKPTRYDATRTKMLVAAANDDPRHYYRLRAAMLAHNCFLVLFSAQTGLNPSVVCALKWAEGMAVDPAQQGFRELKWRAGGKQVSVVIRSNFLPVFKKFLALRSYIMGDEEHDSLFISRGPNFTYELQAAPTSVVSAAQKILRRIDPDLKIIPARGLRAAKQDFHMSQSDPATAAQIMGHSEEVALRAYSAGTKTNHFVEMSGFLASVKQAAQRRVVMSDAEANGETKHGSLGYCVGINYPAPIADNVPVVPDCQKHEGCLFCDKYRVHADAVDVRKLASCAYVIEQTLSVPGADEHFRPVLQRIDEVLGEISCHAGNSGMVAQIVRQVKVNGDLDPYWAAKWTLLSEIEIAQ